PAGGAGRAVGLSHSAARGRRAAHDIRLTGPAAVHLVCWPRHSGARTGAAHGAEHAAAGARLVSIRAGRARSFELAGTDHHVPAYSAAFVPAALDLARRCHGRVSRRRAGFVDYISADLSARGARRLTRRNRAVPFADDRRYWHWFDVYRPDGDEDRLDWGVPNLWLDSGDRRAGRDRLFGATPHPRAARLGLLRGGLVHGYRHGRGASNRSGRFRTAASRHGR